MAFIEFLAILFASTITRVSAQEVNRREKRFLTFPDGSATGILCAIAVPIDLRYRNVFLSYNFEANYGMPLVPSDLIPGPLERLEIIDRGLGREIAGGNETIEESDRKLEANPETITEEEIAQTTESTKNVTKRSATDGLFSRKKIYRTIESYLKCHGHKGRVCLLRAICETAEDPFHAHNGVIGDILHIILTPSTSIKEDLHPEYYKAEELGRSGDCSKYRKYCPECILDYISQIENF
ncbi:uncharacterized protein LOC129786889 [Lutzomyia longipalpis]|uniref:uncharacterized protein LOC129786889 n=1 Tax=Lutzomyia longipalpis TaxID=7200 RepID=UPI002483ED42|nr:uncharacterized protein LOC129786889 [Lutzomyia longipalpis]